MTLHNFDGEEIPLQPGDSKRPYKFRIRVATSETKNDGWIPYGTSVSEAAVTAWNEDTGIEEPGMIEGSPTEADNVITVKLNYTSAGKYKLIFILIIDDGSTVAAYFSNVNANA